MYCTRPLYTPTREGEWMTPGYFQLIRQKFLAMEDASWRLLTSSSEMEESLIPRYFLSIRSLLEDIRSRGDCHPLLNMGARIEGAEILEIFFKCLETWKYNIDEENEESMERLRSVITPLKLIWPKDFTLLSPSELEGKIMQSKKQVERWCRYSIHSPIMMHCEDTVFPVISDYLVRILISQMRVSSSRAGTIVPLKKQIEILVAKIEFQNFMHIRYTKETIEFLNFICDFANSAACLTCLYWAKEDDDEIVSVTFDMLQKFIPYAYDITPLYIGILKSDDLQPMSGSFILGEAVESFVDSFFEHLAIVLKDDFIFLRDRLMFLFTFLTNPPCENAEEGDLIRSHIYAILHQDVYLLLSFEEMNKDFSSSSGP